MNNKWLVDTGYGTGMALAFSGDKNFVDRSINFAYNWLLGSKANVTRESETFAYVSQTNKEKLRSALEREGYCQKIDELLSKSEMPNVDEIEVSDEEIDNYIRSMLKGDENVVDPFAHICPQETPEMIETATVYSKEYAEGIMQTLVGESFMPDSFKGSCYNVAEQGEEV